MVVASNLGQDIFPKYHAYTIYIFTCIYYIHIYLHIIVAKIYFSNIIYIPYYIDIYIKNTQLVVFGTAWCSSNPLFCGGWLNRQMYICLFSQYGRFSLHLSLFKNCKSYKYSHYSAVTSISQGCAFSIYISVSNFILWSAISCGDQHIAIDC